MNRSRCGNRFHSQDWRPNQGDTESEEDAKTSKRKEESLPR